MANAAGLAQVIAVNIYRWSGRAWVQQAHPVAVPGGDLGGGGSITTASLTGSGQPDFVVNSSGADTQWLSVLSDVGRACHAVPFDYGYGPTVAVDAAGVRGHLVETESNGGCVLRPVTARFVMRQCVPAAVAAARSGAMVMLVAPVGSGRPARA